MRLVFLVFSWLQTSAIWRKPPPRQKRGGKGGSAREAERQRAAQYSAEEEAALEKSRYIESAIDNRPPSNIGRACVTTKEAKRKIITASER